MYGRGVVQSKCPKRPVVGLTLACIMWSASFPTIFLTLLLGASPLAVSSEATDLGDPEISVNSTLVLTPTECIEPDECCVHPPDSDEFEQCCEEHGCCPMECPDTTPGGQMIISSQRCHAWECCIYQRRSLQHQECCRSHGCCPNCARIFFGCCFNGFRYAFRTIVQDLPDVCIKLVCSGKLLPHFPYLTPTITAVRTCTFNDMSTECVGCPVNNCVDKFGLVRVDGEVWSHDKCVDCECRRGFPICRGFIRKCPPPPHSGCAVLPGPCCPTYHCEEGCFDEEGVYKPLGSEWPSRDPCEMMICTETGIDTVEISCRPPPPPHEGCFLQPVRGQCCPEWNCSRCLDDDGTYYALHEEWQSGTCSVKVCTETGILKEKVKCPKLGSAPHGSCYKDLMEGRCCEEWKCDGCWEDGILHALGSQWPSDVQCMNNECTDYGVLPRHVKCPDFPRPHESCFEYVPDGECCRSWNCSGCLDDYGTYHPLYHEWQADKCTTLACHLHGITEKKVPCPPLGDAPHFTCYPVNMPGECCSEWKCEGCFDNGVFHLPWADWPSSGDPCILKRCLPGGLIHKEIVTCNESSPSHHGCILQPVEGQCCKQWNCSGCWDEDGKFRKINEEWKSDPCTTHVCTSSGIKTALVACLPPVKPHPNCKLVVLPEACCPSWDCVPYGRSSGVCLDHNGVEHLSGEQWTVETDPCNTYLCNSGEIEKEPIKCEPLPPSASNCFPETVGCCPILNCSSCVDEHGDLRKNGSKWFSVDPCVVLTCVESTIVQSSTECIEPPSSECFKVIQENQCCPEWNCSGCLDKDGVYHGLNETWTSTCENVCTKDGIVKRNLTCPAAPNTTCKQLPASEDLCCPEWQCTENETLANQSDCETEQCQGPPWNADCVSTMNEGDCCPSYSCLSPVSLKPDCESTYCQGPPLYGHCNSSIPEGECCPLYSCKKSSPPNYPCKSGLCLAPPPTTFCTTRPPSGSCCPVYDCEALKNLS